MLYVCIQHGTGRLWFAKFIHAQVVSTVLGY